jgi:hypothetical protein
MTLQRVAAAGREYLEIIDKSCEGHEL